MLVALSAGHNPRRPGAAYLDPASRKVLVTEHDEARAWVELLEAMLLRHNINVRRIGTGELPQKVREVNRDPIPDLAVEIHFNSSVNQHGDHVGRGSETLYAPGSSRGAVAAEFVQGELALAFPPSRGIKEGWYRMDRPGVVDYPGDVDGDENADYFLVHTRCVALIVEPEFIHRTEVYQPGRTAGCAALCRGIEAYLKGVTSP